MTQNLLLILLSFSLLMGTSLAVYGHAGACQYTKNSGFEVTYAELQDIQYIVSMSSSSFFQVETDKCTALKLTLLKTGEISVVIQAIQQGDKRFFLTGTGVLTPEQGHLSVVFSKFDTQPISFDVIYFNRAKGVLALVGCNGNQYPGASDVLILAKDYEVASEEITKALETVNLLEYNTTDVITKNTSSCSLLNWNF